MVSSNAILGIGALGVAGYIGYKYLYKGETGEDRLPTSSGGGMVSGASMSGMGSIPASSDTYNTTYNIVTEGSDYNLGGAETSSVPSPKKVVQDTEPRPTTSSSSVSRDRIPITDPSKQQTRLVDSKKEDLVKESYESRTGEEIKGEDWFKNVPTGKKESNIQESPNEIAEGFKRGFFGNLPLIGGLV